MKVIGAKRIQGVFNDRPYDNYNLYVAPENADNVVFGVCPNVVKVKASVLLESVSDVLALKDKDIDCFYDQYKNVVKINVLS